MLFIAHLCELLTQLMYYVCVCIRVHACGSECVTTCIQNKYLQTSKPVWLYIRVCGVCVYFNHVEIAALHEGSNHGFIILLM